MDAPASGLRSQTVSRWPALFCPASYALGPAASGSRRPACSTFCRSAVGTGSSSAGSKRARRASRSAAHRRAWAASSEWSRIQASTPARLAVRRRAQGHAAAGDTRSHRADGDAQRLGALGAAELRLAHQQQRFALVRRQAGQCTDQVEAQAHAGARVGAVLVVLVLLGIRLGGVQAGHAAVAAALVEPVPVRQRPLPRGLRQVIRRGGVQGQ